jgi:hypothetical protein
MMNCVLTTRAWLGTLGSVLSCRSWCSCPAGGVNLLAMLQHRCWLDTSGCSSRPAGLWEKPYWRWHRSLRRLCSRSSGRIRRVGTWECMPDCVDPSLLRDSGQDHSRINEISERTTASTGVMPLQIPELTSVDAQRRLCPGGGQAAFGGERGARGYKAPGCSGCSRETQVVLQVSRKRPGPVASDPVSHPSQCHGPR